MRRTRGLKLAGALAAVVASAGSAGAEDRSQYTLLNPTPDRLLRELSTDRPDTTESPFTVDAGRIQLETTLFGYARSKDAGISTDSYELGTTNIRIGVTHNTEVDVIWQPYGVVRTRQSDPVSIFRDAGIGGLDFRIKYNLWGNDTFEKAGATALALLPFISLPTDRHNGISPTYVEGGLIVPYAIKLTDKLGLGLNAGITANRDDGASGYHAEYLTSASVSYEWTDKFATYYEVAARFNTGAGDAVVLGTGFTYQLNKNLQLDAGVNFGVTSAADRINPFVGLSTRF
jgi:Putative MetA-pathway of phenol degradation